MIKLTKKKSLPTLELPAPREAINYYTTTSKEIIETMAENCPYAKKILNWIKFNNQDWLVTLSCLEDMNIRGEQIPFAFAYAQNNISVMTKLIYKKDANFIDTINMLTSLSDGQQKAVPSGAIKKLKSLNLFDKMELLLQEKEKSNFVQNFHNTIQKIYNSDKTNLEHNNDKTL